MASTNTPTPDPTFDSHNPPNVADSEKIRKALVKRGTWKDWRLVAAVAVLLAVIGLVASPIIISGQSNRSHDDAVAARLDADSARVESACRSNIAAKLRDADSEVARQNAVRGQYVANIAQGLAEILIVLGDPANREAGQATVVAAIAAIRAAEVALEQTAPAYSAALAQQDAARVDNIKIVDLCRPSDG